MSTPDQTQAREAARQDGIDIRELRECKGFTRYWLRRLRQRREETNRKFHEDPPEKCSKDRREELRQLVIAYDDLLGMMDRDEKVAMAAVE